MEAKTVCKTGLIFFLAFGIAWLVMPLAPHRDLDAAGCGPRALQAVAWKLGSRQSQDTVLALFPDYGSFVSMDDLERVAPKLGLEAHVRFLTIAHMRRERPLGVLHVDGTHFVAVVGYEPDTLLVVDSVYPGESRPVRWFFEDLQMRWDGAILVLSPGRRP